ncbi:MAG TPA: GNAT family N-acetyltransferase [Thermoanaerobaculia bacterium]|jgi:ribosomal-protein-alanine N-acetyltransferase
MDSLQKGRTVYLRHPVRGDLEEFLALVSASRDLHRPWIYPPSTEQAFHAYADRASSERFLGCFICLRETGAIVGVANVSEIVRGVFQSAYLGFYGHIAYSGRGLMRKGLALVLDYSFRKVKLHRLEANVQPENGRSLALVRALGFQREGFSPKYLKIGGRWRDHERWAILGR